MQAARANTGATRARTNDEDRALEVDLAVGGEEHVVERPHGVPKHLVEEQQPPPEEEQRAR